MIYVTFLQLLVSATCQRLPVLSTATFASIDCPSACVQTSEKNIIKVCEKRLTENARPLGKVMETKCRLFDP